MATTWRPNERPPLGLPPGSVRALLALLVVAVVIVLGVRGKELDTLWSETLMIVLAHYFSSRRLVDLPADLQRQLEEAGTIAHEPRPLYLPRHTIRVAIILAFVGLAAYLAREGKLFTSSAMQSIGVVFAYFFGIVFRWLRDWGCKLLGVTPRWWWGDTKAIVAIVAAGACATFYFIDRSDLLLPWQRDAVLGMILFYFGSR